eukprot:2956849-Prymnesium_polylepis.2
MALSPLGFAAMTSRLQQLAGGRLVMVLEGGYKPAAASKAVQACLRVLLNDPSVGTMPCARCPALFKLAQNGGHRLASPRDSPRAPFALVAGARHRRRMRGSPRARRTRSRRRCASRP